MRLGADLIPYPLVDLEGQHRVKQRAGVRLAQAFDRQLRQPGELTAQRTGQGTMASHIIPPEQLVVGAAPENDCAILLHRPLLTAAE